MLFAIALTWMFVAAFVTSLFAFVLPQASVGFVVCFFVGLYVYIDAIVREVKRSKIFRYFAIPGVISLVFIFYSMLPIQPQIPKPILWVAAFGQLFLLIPALSYIFRAHFLYEAPKDSKLGDPKVENNLLLTVLLEGLILGFAFVEGIPFPVSTLLLVLLLLSTWLITLQKTKENKAIIASGCIIFYILSLFFITPLALIGIPFTIVLLEANDVFGKPKDSETTFPLTSKAILAFYKKPATGRPVDFLDVRLAFYSLMLFWEIASC